MRGTDYIYHYFSRASANLAGVKPYVSEIATIKNIFFNSLDPHASNLHQQEEMVISGINTEWLGAVLAFNSSEFIGFLTMNLFRDESNVVEIGFAGVKSNYRRRHIFTSMLQRAERESQQLGMRRVMLDVVSDQIAAKLVEEYGYQESYGIGHSEDYTHLLTKQIF